VFVGIVNKKLKDDDSEEIILKYGIMMEGLNPNNKHAGYWNFFNIVRWTITSLILTVLRNHNEFQIILLLVISLIF
jgi:hypothetical protein